MRGKNGIFSNRLCLVATPLAIFRNIFCRGYVIGHFLYFVLPPIFAPYAKLQLVERLNLIYDYRRVRARTPPTIVSPFETEEQIIKSIDSIMRINLVDYQGGKY